MLFITNVIVVLSILISSTSSKITEEEKYGSIEGMVYLDAKDAPKQETVKNEDKDVSTCGHEVKKENMVVNKVEGKGLAVQYTVVTVDVGRKGKKPDKDEQYVLDQKDCLYTPHIIVARRNGDVILKNSDDVAHNIHIYAETNESKNLNTRAKSSHTEKFRKEEKIKVGCDIHPWMSAYIIVVNNPNYTVITDAKGMFKIDNVPPGKLKLEFWHEELGTIEQEVEVKVGETAKVEVKYKK